MKNENILRPTLVTLVILLFAVFGNIFINGWNWGLFDFIVMGGLIFITGVMIEIINKKIKNKNLKYMTVFLILASFVWLWTELAVGLFTNWGN